MNSRVRGRTKFDVVIYLRTTDGGELELSVPRGVLTDTQRDAVLAAMKECYQDQEVGGE